ncbi:MAG: DUF262 domain-containing protein [Microcystaceae cyanobacterium]
MSDKSHGKKDPGYEHLSNNNQSIMMSTNTTIQEQEKTRQQQEEAEKEIREESTVVDYNTIEYPIEVIVKKFLDGQDNDDNELFIPDYQREMAWDEQRQSKLIESILLGLPISYIYVADVADESSEDDILEAEDLARWELIDGSQRIRTLNRFLNDELELQGLEKLKKSEGFKFSDFSIARQRRFKRTSIRIVQLTQDADEETRRILFERINTGSLQLQEMERRRGIHRGAFLNLIDELASAKMFLNLCHFSKAKINLKDPQEYVLRFFAFLNNYKNFDAKNLTGFLDEYLVKTNEADPENLKNMENEFYRMLDFVNNYFPHGFSQQTSTSYKPVTKIKFESLAVGIALALRQKPDLKPHPKSLQLLNFDEYKKCTRGDGSSSKKKVIRRIEYVRDQLLSE